MGLFKDMKAMKEMVAGAPGLIEQAQGLQAAAQQQAVVQQQAAAAGGGPAAAWGAAPASGPPSEADLEPIAGVSLDLYAEVSRSLASVGYDLTQAAGLAAAHAIAAGDWEAAVEGWNRRMLANPALAQQFHRLYTQQAEA